MYKVSIHMKSGKTITLICKEFSATLNSSTRTMKYEGAIGYSLLTVALEEIEAITAKEIHWYNWW